MGGGGRSLQPAPEQVPIVRKRPQRKPKDEELEVRLQNALILEAQKEALREREKKIAQERDKNIERRQLPAQAAQCSSELIAWDSDVKPIVTRMLTAKEVQDQTQSFEGLVASEGKPRRQSLIISAVRSGSLELVEAVIKELGPCMNVYDAVNFNTPLHFAAVLANSADLTRLLMEHGHRPSVQNRYGWKPADYAKQVGNELVVEVLQNKADANRFAADVGKEASAQDSAEKQANLVLTAVRSKQADLIKFIVPRVPNAGAVVDLSTGNSALHYAVLIQDDPALVLLLLQAGADLQIRCVSIVYVCVLCVMECV
jgi:hypothetical protein